MLAPVTPYCTPFICLIQHPKCNQINFMALCMSGEQILCCRSSLNVLREKIDNFFGEEEESLLGTEIILVNLRAPQ